MNVPCRIALAALLLCAARITLPGEPAGHEGVAVMGLGRLLPPKIAWHPREICAPFGLNNSGQVVGRAQAGRTEEEGTVHAFLSVDGKMTDLGVLPGYEGGSCAFAINDSGQIVGCSGKTEYDGDIKDTHAFLYQKGTMTDLGTLGGSYSKAVAINKTGEIAGMSTTASGEMHAFIDERGKMRDLGTLKSYHFFRVLRMNDSGEIVGAMSADSDENDRHAFYYKDGVIHDLGTFGGSSSVAHAVNDAGEIVGEFSVKGKAHAFLYSGGKMRDLTGSVDTRDSLGAIATEINDRGELLIMVPANDHTTRNYIHRNWTVTNLRTLLMGNAGYIAGSVGGINDAGRLICFGATPEGDTGFLLALGKGW